MHSKVKVNNKSVLVQYEISMHSVSLKYMYVNEGEVRMQYALIKSGVCFIAIVSTAG